MQACSYTRLATRFLSVFTMVFTFYIAGFSSTTLAQEEECAPGETNLHCEGNRYLGCDNG